MLSRSPLIDPTRITSVDDLALGDPLQTLPAVVVSETPVDNRNILVRYSSRLYKSVFGDPASAPPANMPMDERYHVLHDRKEKKSGPAQRRPANTSGILQSFDTRTQLRRLPADRENHNVATVRIHGEGNRLFSPGPNLIKVTSEDPSTRYKELLLARIFNGNRRLGGWEYTIVLIAFWVAMGASSTFKDFGDHFVDSVEKMFGTISSELMQGFLEWFIGLDNWVTQSCLTATTFIHIVSLWTRSLGVPNHEYLKNLSRKEKAALSVVLLTGFSSCKMAYDTLYGKYHWPIIIGISAGALSYTSSSIINLNFFRGMIYDIKGDNNKNASVRLAKRAKAEMQKLANSTESPEEFIFRLADDHFAKKLNNLNLLTSPDEQMESIMENLADTTVPIADVVVLGGFDRSFYIIISISILLGLLASFVNMKAALQVPNFLTVGLLPLIDPFAFFDDLDDKNALDWLSLVLGFFVFGIPSLLVNTIINTRSCENLINTGKVFLPALWRHGLKPYSTSERAMMGTGLIGAGGYSIGKAGSMIVYALITYWLFPEIFAGISLFVFFGLGILSVKTFMTRTRNRWSDHLIHRAFMENDRVEDGEIISGLWNYYRNLSAEDQMTLRRLLLNNVINTLDTIIATLNVTIDNSPIWSDPLNQKIESKFGIKSRSTMVIDVLEDDEEALPDVSIPVLPAPGDRRTLTPPSASLLAVPSSASGSPSLHSAHLRHRLRLLPTPLTADEARPNNLYNLGYATLFHNPGCPSPSLATRRNNSDSNLSTLSIEDAVNADPLLLAGRPHSPDSSASSAGSTPTPSKLRGGRRVS